MDKQVIEWVAQALVVLSLVSAAGMYLGAFFQSTNMILGFGAACSVLGCAMGIYEALQGHWAVAAVMAVMACGTIVYLIVLYRFERSPRRWNGER